MTVIITIFKNGDEYSVYPMNIEAKSGDTVVFKHYLGEKETISLFFPDKNLFGESVYKTKEGQLELVLTVQQPDVASYPYMVYVHSYNDFVTKEAVPKIIIYDANLATS